MRFTFDAELWLWDARKDDSWTFVSLPEDASAEAREAATNDTAPRLRLGAGEATIGGSTCTTSIFPDGARGTYSLPVRKAVRRSEAWKPG